MTIHNAKVEYHRNGSGGDGIYQIAFDSTASETEDRRLMAIIPADDVCDSETGYALPLNTHLERLLIFDPVQASEWATSDDADEPENFRGADYWSYQIMSILLDNGNISNEKSPVEKAQAALGVIVKDANISQFLKSEDPNAFRQVTNAFDAINEAIETRKAVEDA